MDRNLGRSVIWREYSAKELRAWDEKYNLAERVHKINEAKQRGDKEEAGRLRKENKHYLTALYYPGDYHGDPAGFNIQALYDLITKKLNALGGRQLQIGVRYGIHPRRICKENGENIANSNSHLHEFPHQSDPMLKKDEGLKSPGWWKENQAPNDGSDPEVFQSEYEEENPIESFAGFAGSEQSEGSSNISDALNEELEIVQGIVDAEQKAKTRSRIVFYDQESLHYLDGWTRATETSAVFLINSDSYKKIRADGAKRNQELNQFLAQHVPQGRGQRDRMPPVSFFNPDFSTAPLNRKSQGDWDDRMIEELIGIAMPLTIQSTNDQWAMIKSLFAKAKDDARKSAKPGQTAREFVAYFVLDTINATLLMKEANNVTMQNGHADIPLAKVTKFPERRVLPGSDAEQRVIGNIHTHYLLDPLIDLNRGHSGTTIRYAQYSPHSGVSDDFDVASARKDHIVVYAVDSEYLHRANPDGTKNDKLPCSGDVLREALRVFGSEPVWSTIG
jgi:hypothetical protein